MAPGYNTDLQSILNKAMSQLQSLSSGSEASGKSSQPEYVNSIFGLVQNGQEALEGNDEQKAKATVNIIEGLLSMVSFSKNQTAQANKEVKNNADDINKNQAAADKKAQEVQAQIEKITADIAANTTNIQDAISKIQELGGDSGDIAEVQQQITEQLDIIEQAKQDLNNPEKRDEALETIKTAAGAINTLVGNIQNIQTTIEAQNAVVEQSVNNISDLITESATKISEGVADIQQYIQKGTALGAKSSQITAQGGTDVPIGNGEIKLGEAINSNAFSAIGSGGKGAQYIMDGNQRVSAGQTRIQGGAKNLQSLTASIGKMGQDISSLSEFTNAIGKVGEGAASLAEQYTNTVKPYIEATGTWDVDAIIEANTELQSQIESFGSQTPADTNTENGEQKEFLDTKKFRAAFGI